MCPSHKSLKPHLLVVNLKNIVISIETREASLLKPLQQFFYQTTKPFYLKDFVVNRFLCYCMCMEVASALFNFIITNR